MSERRRPRLGARSRAAARGGAGRASCEQQAGHAGREGAEREADKAAVLRCVRCARRRRGDHSLPARTDALSTGALLGRSASLARHLDTRDCLLALRVSTLAARHCVRAPRCCAANHCCCCRCCCSRKTAAGTARTAAATPPHPTRRPPRSSSGPRARRPLRRSAPPAAAERRAATAAGAAPPAALVEAGRSPRAAGQGRWPARPA